MKKFISLMMVAVAALALAGCGGGTGSGPLTGGQSSQGSTPPPVQYNLTVLTSNPQIPSDGSKTATITALVRDSNNNVVSGVAVGFQASSGAVAVTTATTGPDGTAAATLSTAGDPTNRDIKVTATAGGSTATVDVSVIGTKLSLSGPNSLVINSPATTYSVTLTDSGNNGITGQTVNITSANDNTINPPTVTTDASGQASFTVTAVKSGTDTITAAADGLQATESVAVSNDSFTFTSPTANQGIDLGQIATVTVVWTSSGTAQVGQPVQFSATRGTLSAASATTDTTGSASVTISSTAAGPSVITATGNGVTAQIIVDFVATNPSAISVQASPSNIPTQGQSTITATVRDANNNLVEGRTVDFQLSDSTGGTLSVGSATTNVQGQATTVYTASTTSSATNGVIVTGTVAGTAIAGQAALTVGGQTVFLSLGTGNKIISVPPVQPQLPSTQYEMPFTVQAIDSAGNGVDGVVVSFTVTSLGYLKGTDVWAGTDWVAKGNTAASDPDDYSLGGINGCKNEDINNTGIYEASEDYNNNGKLDPGLVASTDVSSGTTANGGTAAVNLIYPEDHAYWVAVRLTATATVNGTQSSTSQDFWLPGASTDFGTQSVAPPGQISPYGTAALCSEAN